MYAAPKETDFANTNTDRRMRVLNYQCKPVALLTMLHNETPECMMLLPVQCLHKVSRECKGAQLLIVPGLLHHPSVVTQIIFTLKAARSVFPSLSVGNVTNYLHMLMQIWAFCFLYAGNSFVIEYL
ncbi:unnamed protein product [Ixodes pacificus]